MGTFAFSLRTLTPSAPVLGAAELRRNFLTGLPTHQLSDQAARAWLLAAERTVEQTLDIKISRQEVEEELDVYVDDPRQTFYLRTSFPVVAALELRGGSTEAAKAAGPFPAEWLQVKKTSSATGYERKIFVVPQGAGTYPALVQVTFTGLMSQSSWGNRAGILPRYWRVRYLSGYDQLPEELVQLIGNLASIPALYKLANLVLPPGLASQSISLDGLSQNLSTSNPYGTTIKGYLDWTTAELARLKGIYGGMLFEVL